MNAPRLSLRNAGLAIAALLFVFVGARCATKEMAPSYRVDRDGDQLKDTREEDFSQLRVVNGKPFADMYFKNFGVNPTIDTEEENVSTFAVDVDTASYSLARAYLSRGQLPDEDGVRVEEFVNAFDYDYPNPAPAPFGVTVEAFPSPNRHGYYLLHLGLKGREIPAAERKPANLVFTIDVSGSMAIENRLGFVKQALAMLVEQLDARDTVAIVVYGDDAHAILEPTRATDKARILSAIDALRPEGSTNAQAGILLAYELAAKSAHAGTVSRVILCSDGVANNGITEADAIFDTVKAQAAHGVTLTTVGFGMGNYNDVLMERLADVGDGQYAYVDRLDEAKRIFVEQLTGTLQVVAKDVKVQLEFDRDLVSRYRLIGFENRHLENRDFANDKVDAGEIGAGQTVTAIYEVKFKGADTMRAANFATLRLRYKDPEGGDSRLVENPLPTSVVRPSLSSASPSSRLSVVVALFAEKLRGSYWARNVRYADLLQWWSELPAATRERAQVSELRELIAKCAELDRRKDKYEDKSPIANMNFDELPVVR